MKSAVRNTILVAIAAIALAAGYFTSRTLAPEPDQSEPTLVDFSLPDLGGQTRWISDSD